MCIRDSFSRLAACVLTLLQQEARRRRVSRIDFVEDELVVVVCAAIRRGVGPLQVVLDALLSDAAVRAQFGLESVRADHVQARLPGDLTGPSATYALVARHPRFRARSQGDWQDGDLQHHGRQTVDELNYSMESRPERGLYIFMHRQPPLAASGSRGARDILGKQSLEANPALQVARHEVDCDNANVFAGPALFRDDAGAWKATLEFGL